MICIDNILVSDEIRDVRFCCNLEKCKGACCIEGDAGAPLTEEEISLLEDYKEKIIPYMRSEGVREIEKNGVFDYDAAARFVTPLVRGKECVYVIFEDDIARCAIEKAYCENAIPFPKPISCHLYPVRISRLKRGEAVNYHNWYICSKALEKGKRLDLPLYRFLEDSLIRKFGKTWYDSLAQLLK